jgi:hypothetical protein
MSFLMLWLLKAALVLPVAAFIAYQNKHHKRSIWDTEEAVPVQGSKITKD